MQNDSIKFVGKFIDPDSTEKFVFKDDNGTIEIVRINTKSDRDIFCVPSLYGCGLGCSFCFLTTLNIPSKANMKVSYETIINCLNQIDRKHEKRQISVMGVGDASLNLELINKLCESEEMVSMATIMPYELPKLPQKLKLHLSLHSPFDEKRIAIMPSAKVPVSRALGILSQHTGKKEIHYTLIEGVNDSDEELSKLIELVGPYSINVKFLDFKESGDMKKSSKINKFIKELGKVTTVESYNPPGQSIQGSCGQFTDFFYKDDYENSPEYKKYSDLYQLCEKIEG